jgi:predicted  nucleic acid-binding Zn-ribbon protein
MEATSGAEQAQHLCERLLRQQPESKALLEKLLARLGTGANRGAFALITDGRCAACHVTVAAARLQRAKGGKFINCANCSRFLYVEGTE